MRGAAALTLVGTLVVGGGCGDRSPATDPAAAGLPATRADLAELARSVERLRAEVEGLRREVVQLRTARPDAEQQFFVGERARHRAALRRGRAQVIAWKPGQTGDMVAVADRAVQTIDHFVGAIDKVADIDGLIGWFDAYLATRQQWPPNQAWLLPELLWR